MARKAGRQFPDLLRTAHLTLTRPTRSDRGAMVALEVDPSVHPFSDPPTRRQARATARSAERMLPDP